MAGRAPSSVRTRHSRSVAGRALGWQQQPQVDRTSRSDRRRAWRTRSLHRRPVPASIARLTVLAARPPHPYRRAGGREVAVLECRLDEVAEVGFVERDASGWSASACEQASISGPLGSSPAFGPPPRPPWKNTRSPRLTRTTGSCGRGCGGSTANPTPPPSALAMSWYSTVPLDCIETPTMATVVPSTTSTANPHIGVSLHQRHHRIVVTLAVAAYRICWALAPAGPTYQTVTPGQQAESRCTETMLARTNARCHCRRSVRIGHEADFEAPTGGRIAPCGAAAELRPSCPARPHHHNLPAVARRAAASKGRRPRSGAHPGSGTMRLAYECHPDRGGESHADQPRSPLPSLPAGAPVPRVLGYVDAVHVLPTVGLSAGYRTVWSCHFLLELYRGLSGEWAKSFRRRANPRDDCSSPRRRSK